MSRPIIVDADVATACGRNHRHPATPDCQKALDTILGVCHCAAVSAELLKEWKEHAGGAVGFQRWWRRMHGQKKIKRVELEDYTNLSEKLVRLGTGDKDKEEIRKDVHLLAAALQVTAPVLSLDDTARTRFKALSQQVGEIRTVVWVNPAHQTEGTERWLRADAPSEPRRRLDQP